MTPGVPFPPPEPRQGFRLLAHTADAGIKAWAPDLGGAFAQGAAGLFSLLCPLDQVAAAERWTVDVAAESLDVLLVEFLSEALFLHEVELAVFKEAVVEVGPDDGPGDLWRVAGFFAGEKIDLDRHTIHGHVKAVTWHGLEVTRGDGGWQLQVIVDL